jgi:hypothetical protein
MLEEQAIIKEGNPAAAILLDYWDTGTTINENPQIVAFVAFATSQDQLPEPGIEQSGGLYSQSDLVKVRLAELDELRLQHMITEADYTRRRDELLNSPPTAR